MGRVKESEHVTAIGNSISSENRRVKSVSKPVGGISLAPVKRFKNWFKVVIKLPPVNMKIKRSGYYHRFAVGNNSHKLTIATDSGENKNNQEDNDTDGM